MNRNQNDGNSTCKWFALSATKREEYPMPKFGSVWMIDENIWKVKLKPQGYHSRPDRKHHPGAACLDTRKPQIGLHNFVIFLFGSSSNSSILTLEIASPNIQDPNHKTYFGAYKPTPLPKFQWDNSRKEKKSYESHNIHIDIQALRKFLRKNFNID